MDSFNYDSIRAKKARLGKKLNNVGIRLLLILLLILFLFGGGYLICLRISVGFLVLSLAVIVLMVMIWRKYDLTNIAKGKTENINDILSDNCLASLPKNPTPKNIAEIIPHTRSGRFLATRFGITPDLLRFVADNLGSDPTGIFKAAREIYKRLNGEVVSGGMLAIAILENYPESELILKKMKLEKADLYAGMDWYNHWFGVIKNAKARKKDGGIARDLSFGYTPLLQRFGQNISSQLGSVKTQILQNSRQDVINKMMQIFSSGGRQNVALVGPMGSGKTTTIRAFAERLMDAEEGVPSNLRYRQIVTLDASSLLSAATEKGELEGLMMRIMSETFGAKNIILCLDNAHLFFEEGVGSVNISNILLPIIEAGRLRLIFTIDEQKFLEISARNSALANALNTIAIEPANELETMKIMEDQVPFIEAKHQAIVTYWALREAYHLSERYIHDLVQPGRALNLLESAASYGDNGFIMAESVQRAVEQTKGVKVQAAENEEDKTKLLNLEKLIHERMIDQEGAVKTVSDALRRAAAKVRNESRPIGTFLFLGPTGVGKTELAKAISEVYFNGEKNIIRLDLNEFVNAEDVNRLIAEGANNATSLTAQVMKQPFSVVLLDEIEKAHPQVLTTLLQLLDEGVLRDEKNREVSFRDTIVIATSNAGADKIREYITAGRDINQLKEELTNEMIRAGQFKPEFLNRFDEICLFGPLSKENLLKVVDIMIAGVNQTLAPQKITVNLTDDAKILLVEKGYDPLLGARPMRRIVQKTVENLVAKALLSGQIDAGAAITITAEMVAAQLS